MRKKPVLNLSRVLTLRARPRVDGAVLWRGKSPVDGAPLVLVATGFQGRSKNTKTGRMIQTWILREDVAPDEAVKTGEDRSICGNCPHRANPVTGKRTCYVTVFRAPLAVWKAFRKGAYVDLSDSPEDVAQLVSAANLPLRCGSYGDPAMVPAHLWAMWTAAAPNWTGYTHQSGEAWFSAEYLNFLMVSREGEFDPNGPRSFRVIPSVADVAKGEVLCPASEEAGMRTECARCGLCKGGGSKAKSVAIVAHGAGAKGFVPLRVVA